MATEQIVQSITLPVAGDLSASQYLGVSENSSGQAIVATTLGQAGVGILQNDPASAGRAATIAVQGVVKGMLGASVTTGVKVTVMANGRFQTAGSGHHVWGSAHKGGANGDIGEILLESQMLLP